MNLADYIIIMPKWEPAGTWKSARILGFTERNLAFWWQHKIPLEAKGNVYAVEKMRLVCEFEVI